MPTDQGAATPHLDRLQGLNLGPGAHTYPDDGLCFMEAVAYVFDLEHTDCPPCVSNVLAEFGRAVNDLLDNDIRQRLIPLIPLVGGTAADGFDEQRTYIAVDWYVRTWLPIWIDLLDVAGGPGGAAAAIRALPALTDLRATADAERVVLAASRRLVPPSSSLAREGEDDHGWLRLTGYGALHDAANMGAQSALWIVDEDARRLAAYAVNVTMERHGYAGVRDTVRALQGGLVDVVRRMALVGRPTPPDPIDTPRSEQP